VGLASIIVLGIGARWLAWRLRLPAILFLLIFGLVAGPVTGFLDPDSLLGNLLLPVVSLSVAVILFEGGLNLSLRELPQIGRVLRNLVSLGAAVTWVISAGAAYLLVDLDIALAVLLGAILVVTGPTVIGPLLRDIRPAGQVGPILRWEGMVIDPVGAMLAVLVFEAILADELLQAAALVALGVVKTIAIGGLLGLLGAGVLLLLLKRYWVPDFLQNPVSLMMVISVFTAANVLQAESCLLAATVMGVALANQKTVSVKHIIEFKENLRVLLISGLFTLLAARLQVGDLVHLGMGSLAFLGVLILIARPAAVALSTLRSGLSWQERLFLAWMAPRGIVAAAVSSIFALRLAEAGYVQAERLVPLTFLVIIGTVALYGLTAAPVARWLQIAKSRSQGALIVGAHAWARAIASTLHAQGYRVLLVDTNWANISAARLAGLPTYHGNILAEDASEKLELDGIGCLLALTSNDEVNALAALHFAEIFGRAEVYQLPPKGDGTNRTQAVPQHLRGRFLFGTGMTYPVLSERCAAGAVLKKTPLTKEFDYGAFQARYGAAAIPLFLIDSSGNLMVWTTDQKPTPRPGQTLISLANPGEETSTQPLQVFDLSAVGE
jgi:NhaP-type Na+/H+ or K+/H+ antiporter